MKCDHGGRFPCGFLVYGIAARMERVSESVMVPSQSRKRLMGRGSTIVGWPCLCWMIMEELEAVLWFSSM